MSSSTSDDIPLWSMAAPSVSAVLTGLLYTHAIPETPVVLILAAAVTIIEVGLIVSIMLSGAQGSEMVARDTVFSAIMIVLNGVIGLALVLGAGKHHEQALQVNATSAALGFWAPGFHRPDHHPAEP